MKYLVFFVFISLIACSSTGAEQKDDVSEDPQPLQTRVAEQPAQAEPPNILVHVEGLEAGSARLIGTFADQRYLADSARINANGDVVFSKEEPYNQGFYVLSLPNNITIQLLITEDQTFSMKTDAMMVIPKMEVEGSLDNTLLYQALKFEEDQRAPFNRIATQLKSFEENSKEYKDLKKEQDALVADRTAFLDKIFKSNPETLFTKFKRAGQNPEVREFYKDDGTLDNIKQVRVYRSEFWDNVDFSDDRLLHTPVIVNKLTKYIKQLTTQQPDSIISSAAFLVNKVLDYPEYFKFFANWITLQYEPTKTTLMDAEAVYVYMVENYFTYERAFWADSVQTYALQKRAYEMAASLVGKKGPDVKAKDPDGRLKSIYEIQAPYIIVYLYSPNCEHCQKETPKLIQFYKEWKPKGLEVYAIAIDTDDEEWRAYVRKNDMPWINVYDPTNVAIYAKYFVNITPEIYVLNADRTIIGKNLKVNQIETIINRDKNRKG